jgi:hypothetical protein
MAQSNIDIKIIAEFLGKNAFKQADTAANKLNRTVKSLGQSFGLAFGGAALGYAVKSTIKDFADAQRETVVLTNTVKNLGLAFDAPQVAAYVEQIGKLYGVTGDQAVPAMQALLSVTGSVSKSTQIMNTALDLAASRSTDVASVAQDLANAYVGNTKGLNQYRLGLTKAELSAKTFQEIMTVISEQTLGAADEAAGSLSGQLAILAEVSNQAKERIGGGLFQALGGLSGANGAGGAAKNIENLSIKLTEAITGFGYLVQEVKIATPILAAAGVTLALAWAPWLTAIGVAALSIGAIGNAMKKSTPQTPVNTGKLFFPGAGDGGYEEREKARKKAEQEAIARNKQLAKLIKDQAKSAANLVKQKKLQAAIDKANLLLGKGGEAFDLDAIQLNAAMINQAEQLGKATSSAQELAIMNDIARLNVKRSMYDLEQAILSGDVAAIEAASAKLNKNLEILATLTGQNAKLVDIKSLLEGMQPKDLIDQANLDEALLKIKEILALMGNARALSLTQGARSTDLGSGIPSGDYISPIDTTGGSIEAILEYAEAAGARADAFAILQEQQNYADYLDLIDYQKAIGDLGGYSLDMNRSPRPNEANTIIVNTGVGDPNAIAEAVNQVLQDAIDRGTLRGGMFA